MVVGHDTLAHRRGKERQLRALDKGADIVFGARPPQSTPFRWVVRSVWAIPTDPIG
jgi:hypothetical protein